MVAITFAALADSSLFWEFAVRWSVHQGMPEGVSLACVGYLPLTSCLAAAKEQTSQAPSDG